MIIMSNIRRNKLYTYDKKHVYFLCLFLPAGLNPFNKTGWLVQGKEIFRSFIELITPALQLEFMSSCLEFCFMPPYTIQVSKNRTNLIKWNVQTCHLDLKSLVFSLIYFNWYNCMFLLVASRLELNQESK